jgi:EAL domain-containing protein (putative c-di-GMP-specific phosphodiesterase class I)/CheY-like chemotaxis protein
MSETRGSLLVIDDDVGIAALIHTLGEQAGYVVDVIADSKEVESAASVSGADIIVLDLQMPGLDGVQVLRLLAERKTRAGIVIVSGTDQRTRLGAELFGKQLGLKMLASVAKPFDPEELVECLRSARAVVVPLTREDLENAIDNDELLLVFQPTVRRRAGQQWTPDTVEALVRWDHPGRGLLGPEHFLAMGEASGLILPITDYVIQRGLEQLKAWQSSRPELGLRLNLSATLLTDIDFPDRLARLIDELELDPFKLTLEIAETATLDRHPGKFDILTRIRLKNVNLAIDDFGIGYSSLTQLFRMPFGEMKIDRSVLADLPASNEATIMVKALINLAHDLGLSVCAEGVESESVLDRLAEFGCDSAQGYFISRPLRSREVLAKLKELDEQLQGRKVFPQSEGPQDPGPRIRDRSR